MSSMQCTVYLTPKNSTAQNSKGIAWLQRQQKARWKRHGITPKAAKCNIQKAQHHSKAENQIWVVAGVVHGTSWELEKVRGNGVMAMLTLAIISVVAALQVFGKDRLIFWRESESGELLLLLACLGIRDVCTLLQVASPWLYWCCSAIASLVDTGQSAGCACQFASGQTLYMQQSCATTAADTHLTLR